MHIPFSIYFQALGIYLLLTLPALFAPFMYLYSGLYAIVSGFAAIVIFAAVFFMLHTIKPSITIVISVLIITVVAAVAVAYALLLKVIMHERDFFEMDVFTLFPLAAVVSGWLAIAISRKNITNHFVPVTEKFETIFTE